MVQMEPAYVTSFDVVDESDLPAVDQAPWLNRTDEIFNSMIQDQAVQAAKVPLRHITKLARRSGAESNDLVLSTGCTLGELCMFAVATKQIKDTARMRECARRREANDAKDTEECKNEHDT